jgi:hypothetical protein
MTKRRSGMRNDSVLFFWKNTKGDENEKSDPDKEVEEKSELNNMANNPYLAKVTEPIKRTFSSIEAKWILLWDTLLSVLPAPVVKALANLMQKLSEILPTLRTISLSFLAGGIVAVVAVVVPVFTHVDKFTQPITLFETILSDLDERYVVPYIYMDIATFLLCLILLRRTFANTVFGVLNSHDDVLTSSCFS